MFRIWKIFSLFVLFLHFLWNNLKRKASKGKYTVKYYLHTALHGLIVILVCKLFGNTNV